MPSVSWTQEATSGRSSWQQDTWDVVLGGPYVWARVRQHVLKNLQSYRVSSLMTLGQN